MTAQELKNSILQLRYRGNLCRNAKTTNRHQNY